jgi:hypothetical protein
MAKRVNKAARKAKWAKVAGPWPEEEAVAFAVQWANYVAFCEEATRFNKRFGPRVVAYHKKQVVAALKACLRAMSEMAHIGIPNKQFDAEFRAATKAEFLGATDTVRHWVACAVDAGVDGPLRLPPKVVNEINVELDRLQGQIKIRYRNTGFAKNRLTERFSDFRPTPLTFAALGVAFIADNGSQWGLRVGRCHYHHDRFVFNAPEADGQRGPLRTFYCTKGCAVQLSRSQRKKRAGGVSSQVAVDELTHARL